MKLALISLFAACQFLQTALCHNIATLGYPKYAITGGESLPGRYLIEFHPEASFDFVQSLKDNDAIKIRRVYNHTLFQGLSIEITDTDKEFALLHSILDHSDIAVVSPNKVIKGNSATISSQQKISPKDIQKVLPHDLHQVDKVKKELGLNGEGIFVGIIDTGIDYRLPALGGGFGEGFKVATGWDFVGYDDNNNDGSPRNDSNPLDLCDKYSGSVGHGTHVAGIIGGYDPQNNFEGVAPNVKLGMWRALGCNNQGSSESLAEAAMAAYSAGVNILSFSVGSNTPWTNPNTPEYKIFQRMTESGIFVVISAANSGDDGAYTVTSYLSSSFSVASAVNKYKPTPLNLKASGVKEPICALPYPFINHTESAYVNGELYIPYTEYGGEQALMSFCNDESVSEEIDGKIVLIFGLSCSIETASARIKALGGIGVITFTDKEYLTSPGYLEVDTVPVVKITKDSARILMEVDKKHHGRVKIEFFKPEEAIALNRFERTISGFSSVGPTVDLSFSPNIAAVGENVFSTVPEQLGGYGFMSGTSMSAPYISGTLALYLQYHGINKTKPEVVLAKYKNYASLLSLHSEGSGTIESPLRQGAGLVQVFDTITQSAYVMPPEITFKDSSFEAEKTQALTITNEGNEIISYRVYNNVSTAIVPYKPDSFTFATPSGNRVAKAEIQISSTEITLNPGESKTVTVKVSPPSTDPREHIIYGGYIQFSPIKSSTHKAIHVPYFGVVGNQKDLPIFDHSTVNFTYYDDSQNYTYVGKEHKSTHLVHTLNNATLTHSPFIDITFHTYTPAMLTSVDVLDYETRKVIGTNVANIYTGTLTTSYTHSFDGTYCTTMGHTLDDMNDSYTCGNTLTSGTYYLRLSAIKVFGDESNPKDHDYWISSPFTVQVA